MRGSDKRSGELFSCVDLEKRVREKRLLSSEPFSVDGTLIEAWASMKSFRPKDPPQGRAPREGGRNTPADFNGEKRSNETHAGTTDPEARLYRKGPGMEAKLCSIGDGLRESRSGLIVDVRLTLVSAHAERLAALDMIRHRSDRKRAITLGADRGCDAADFAFAAAQAGGELEYAETVVFFRWQGFDEGNEISGDASAELRDDGTIEIELSSDNGDDATQSAAASECFNSRPDAFRGTIAWPARSPADASPTPLRTRAHGSGPRWIATPSSSCARTTHCSPVSWRTPLRRPLTSSGWRCDAEN